MTNNSKIVILFCSAAVFIAVSIDRPTAYTRDRGTEQSKKGPKQNMQPQSILAQVANDQKPHKLAELTSAQEEVLKVIKDGLSSLASEDNTERASLAKAGHLAMESFLQNWNPIGKTTHELKTLFGAAKEENDDHFLYAFDNGNYAWLYQFTIRNGRVTELTRPLSE